MSSKGYFLDWNGQVRCTDDPGHGYCCEVDKIARQVTVISKRGATVHEAKLYRSLDAIAQTGIQTELVSGSYPFVHGEVGHVAAARKPASSALRKHGATRRARAPQWLHELRDRCTTSARHVYALFKPGTDTPSRARHQSPTLLDDLAEAIKTAPNDPMNSMPRLSDPNYFVD